MHSSEFNDYKKSSSDCILLITIADANSETLKIQSQNYNYGLFIMQRIVCPPTSVYQVRFAVYIVLIIAFKGEPK